jgi:RNA polymerase sigma factor (sigma-70 family)
VNGRDTSCSAAERSPVFASTHWSLVLAAADTSAPDAAAALERLCRSYWYPLYAYVRRRRYSPEDAQDLTQEFFHQVLARNWLPQADRQRGRFRSFLLAAMNHFLGHEWERAKAVKRGGRIVFQSFEDLNLEQRFLEEADLARSPEELYDQRWATTLLQTVLSRLREQETSEGRLEQFNALEGCLTGEGRVAGYSELASQLGTTEGALKMAAQRLRARYARLLQEEIATTVGRPEEIQDEIRHLLAVLSR